MNDSMRRCIICGKGSWNGIRILGKFICPQCEENVVHTDVFDENYDIYKDLIKKNIYGDIIFKQSVK